MEVTIVNMEGLLPSLFLNLKGDKTVDNMMIKSDFMTGLIGRMLEKLIRKKIGKRVTLLIDNLSLVNENGYTNVHVSLSGNIKNEDLDELLSKLGD